MAPIVAYGPSMYEVAEVPVSEGSGLHDDYTMHFGPVEGSPAVAHLVVDHAKFREIKGSIAAYVTQTLDRRASYGGHAITKDGKVWLAVEYRQEPPLEGFGHTFKPDAIHDQVPEADGLLIITD